MFDNTDREADLRNSNFAGVVDTVCFKNADLSFSNFEGPVPSTT